MMVYLRRKAAMNIHGEPTPLSGEFYTQDFFGAQSIDYGLGLHYQYDAYEQECHRLVTAN